VAVGNVLILKVKVFKVAFCFIQILSRNTNMKDNLSCMPAEIREIDKNMVANLLPDKFKMEANYKKSILAPK
jgi:hypothetical protein